MADVSKRFWDKVRRGAPAECWQWTGGKCSAGYGLIWTGAGIEYAHRVALRATGISIDGLVVRHDCDNPSCVNPGHLRIGSHADNALDRDVRGRLAKARLTADQVRAIRNSTLSSVALAQQFGVTYQNIWNIRNRKTWRHV